jgi:2-oxoglutarate/2-oxoacid ferredoxin oxidoreductase subunit alpha
MSSSANQSEVINLHNAVIRFAGNSQDGIQTIGGLLAKLAGRSDREVVTYMTIPSTISGGPSIFQVHLGSGEVLSAGDESDFLVAFYQHSYDSHIRALKKGGICIYDSDEVNAPHLDNKEVVHVPIPITSATVEAMGGSARDRGKNIFVLGLVTALFKLNKEKIIELVTRQFGRKSDDILRNAMVAFDTGFAYPIGDILKVGYDLKKGAARGENRVTTDGNTALTLGLLAGGVRYGAGYPITPWSPVMEMLRAELPKYGGIFVQCEDELAAVSMALGFAYSGHVAITGSSGPGLSLKMEALSYATMAELPIVVINVQRGGPSTGLPTSVEQSDLMQAIYGSHGDCPRIVVAPKNVEDCYHLGKEACELAVEYSCPVIVLSDQAISSRIEAFRSPDLSSVVEPVLDLSPRPESFKPYPLDARTRHAPPGAPMEGGKYPVVTGLEHDEWGHPTGSPELHTKMNAKRRNKIKALVEKLPTPQVFGDAKGRFLLVGWGSTWGPIREATTRLREEHGHQVGSIHFRHLNPLPKGIEDIFANYDQILCVEMNDEGLYGFGQFASLLRARYANPKIKSICKTDGLTYKVSEVVNGVLRIAAAS